MATANLTASGNYNTLWSVYGYANIASQDGPSTVASADRSDDGEGQGWIFQPTGISGTITQIKVRVYHRFIDEDAGDFPVKTVSVRIRVNGTFTSTQTFNTSASGFVYSEITFSGSWTDAEAADTVVQIYAPAAINTDQYYQVDHVEPVATYTPAGPPSTLYRLGGGNWSDTTKWSATSGGSAAGFAPIAATAVVFDANSSGTVVIDGDIEIASLSCQFTGTLDGATGNYDVTINGDCTLACTNLSWGIGDWTVAGSLSIAGMTNAPTTVFGGASRAAVSRMTLTGSSKTLSGKGENTGFGALIITGSYTVAANTIVGHTFDLQGSVSINSGIALICRCTGTSAEGILLADGATVTGAGVFWISGTGLMQFGAGATLNAATLNLIDNTAITEIVSCTIGSATVNFNAGLGHTYKLSGGIVFTGNVNLLALDDAQPSNVIVDNSDADPTITFRGNLTFSESGGYVVQWDAGDGGVIFDGTGAQAINVAGENLGHITINKASGTLTLTGDAACESFTLTQGTINLDGYDLSVVGDCTIGVNGQFSGDQDGSVISVGGNLSLTGEVADLLVIDNLNFDVSGSATASYCTVTNSDASAGTRINGSDETNTDNGGNLNWLFEITFLPAWAINANTMIGA